MSNTTKPFTDFDQAQIFKKVYNPTEGTLAVGTFVAGKIGNVIEREVISATVDRFHYMEGSTLLHTLEVTYNNSEHDEVNRVERIA